VHVDSYQGGFATTQEIRSLIKGVSDAGKWTAAYFDTAGEFAPGNSVYYLASACDEVSLNPAGDVNLIGMSARSPFVRGTMDKLGIEPEFPGRGDYKSARFMYTERDFTPAHREMMGWLIESLMTQMVGDIAEQGADPGRSASSSTAPPTSARRRWRPGSSIARSGRSSKRIEERAARADVVGLRAYLKRSHGPRGGTKIAVVSGIGAIMRGPSGKGFGLFGAEDVMGSETVAKAFRDAREAHGVKAVVFRVDSPGGSALASEIIRREMVRTADKLPVVVSMKDVAASGGYWVSCGARRIVADPGTLTGSIGVLGGHLNMDRFWADKLGVTFGRLDAGRNANLYGSLESWTMTSGRSRPHARPDRRLLAAPRSAGISRSGRHPWGRVWTGAQAVNNTLVDELGGPDRAIAAARARHQRRAGRAGRLPKLRRGGDGAQYGDGAARAELEHAVADRPPRRAGPVWMPPVFVE
jgi:protease-4